MPIYQDYRNHIQSGDLLVWSTGKIRTFRNFQLKVVQLLTLSSYDHVGIAWSEGSRMFVVEATYPEIRIYPLSKLLPFYHLPMKIEWKEEYDEYLLERVGDKYSLWQVLMSYFTRPAKDREWQCAEFVHEFYQMIGLGDDFGYTPKTVIDKASEISCCGLVKVI